MTDLGSPPSSATSTTAIATGRSTSSPVGKVRPEVEGARLFRYVYEVAKFLDGPKLYGTDDDAPVMTAKSQPLTPLEVAS